MKGLPPLHALACAEAAVRHASMTAAARELGLTHGAISRQVRIVEEALGTALFVRGHRRLVATREGEAIGAAMARALAEIRSGIDEARRSQDGPLVVSCEPTLTVAWLIPRMPALARHGLEVHVTQAGGAIDLAQASVDVALRRDDFGPSPYVRAPVWDEWLGPVCAPALARRLAVTLLHTRTRRDAWGAFRGDFRPRGDLWFDHFGASLQAAIAGLGVAIGPYPLVRDGLRDGRLVAPRGFRKGEVGYVVLTRRPLEEDPRARLFVEWLRAEGKKMAREASQSNLT